MSMSAVILLEQTGPVLRAAHIGPPILCPNYGQILPYILDELNSFCGHLGVPSVSTFCFDTSFCSPEWFDAIDGLKTFEPILSELIYRFDSDLPEELNRVTVLWEVRAFEQVLNVAERRNERFYISIS